MIRDVDPGTGWLEDVFTWNGGTCMEGTFCGDGWLD